jgi:hypothetical protein
MLKIESNVDLKKAEKLEIINQELTKLYNKLKLVNYTTEATLTIIKSIKELELLKVTLEAVECVK